MKTNKTHRIIPLLLLAGALAAPQARAQSTDTWVGGTDNTFGTIANWTFTSGSGPVASGDSLVFGAVGLTNVNNNLTGLTIASITYLSGAQGFTNYGNAFTLGTTTPATAITDNSANTEVISNSIVLATAAQGITISLPGGKLILAGTNSGAGGLTLPGPGTLTLQNASWELFTGPTVVNGGTLMLNFPNAGTSGLYTNLSGSLTINSGGTVAVPDNSLSGSAGILGTCPVTINAGGILTGVAAADTGEGGSTHLRGVLTLNGGTLANAGTGVETAYGDWDFDDGVVVNGGTTTSTINALDTIPTQTGGTVFNLANGGTSSGIDLLVTGNLINGSSLADTGIIVTNNGPNGGTLALYGTNTYTGATTVKGGTLEINGAGELGAGNYGGAITISNTGTFIYNSSQPQTLSGAIADNGVFTQAGSGALTLSGVVSGTGTLTYSGAGALILSGANTFTGPVSISTGTLTVAGAGKLGNGNYAGNITDGGALIYNSSTAQTNSGVISGGGTLTQMGGGSLALAGVSTYTGNTIVSNSTLVGVLGGSVSSTVVLSPSTGNSATLSVSSAGTSSQWTCGGLTCNAGGTYDTLQFSFTATPSTTIPPLNVTGNVNFIATPVVVVNPANLVPGTYPLLVVGGTAPTTVPILSLIGYSGSSLAWNGNTLDLIVTGSPTTRTEPINWTASGAGLWDLNDNGNTIWKDSSATPQTTDYQQLPGQTGDSVVFGDQYVSANTTVTLNSSASPTAITVTNSLYNYTITGSGTIAGTGGLTKTGKAALTISTAGSFTGGVTANGGTVTEDFTQTTSPAANILGSANALTLGGSGVTLNINGNATVASSQTFASTTLAAGYNVINLSGTTLPTLNLGALTETTGAMVVFNGPATIVGTNLTTTNNLVIPATGTITTTTSTTGAYYGIMYNSSSDAGYATVGLYDWASTYTTADTAGTSPYTIIGGSQIPGFYTNNATGNTARVGNIDVIVNGNSHNTESTSTIRFNTSTATNYTLNSTVDGLGLLVTPNMGTNNAFLTGAGPWEANRSGANRYFVIWQNNTNGLFVTIAPISDTTAGPDGFMQGGLGTVEYLATGSSASTFTGQTYFNNGVAEIITDSNLGAPATAAQANLNGGTILGGATFTLDNSGANLRPVALGLNGGGLAAVTGFTMTVDGVVSGALGTGPLVIGIPGSAANGNIAGLVPGTGPNTANPVGVYATGKVVLNNPNGNTFYGGAIIVGGATLNINGNWALGGADYLGGLTIANGTLQYNTTLNSSTDISQSSTGVAQKVTISGPATIDVNGQSVAYANPIGNGGAGSLTITNSGSPGVGGLALNGGITYTGGTFVDSGAVLGGTGTIAGNVTWNSGSYAALTGAATLTVSGTLTLNGPTVQLPAAEGLTTGVYTLLTATGGITGGSTVTAAPVGTGAIANGYGGTVTISGNSVILTVIQLGVADTWTDNLADQNWSELGNWSGGAFVPQNPGDAAIFGTGGVGQPVNLNVSETVGGITFDNAGSYTITGANTLTFNNKGDGAQILVTGGTANAINTAITLNDTLTATVGSGESLTLGGIIANGVNPETVTLTGGGTVVLSGANSYGPAAGAVGTTLSGPILQVGNNSALGAGDVNVTANSTLSAGAAGLNLLNNLAVASGHTLSVSGNGNVVTLGGVISGNGVLASSGTGTVIISGVNNTYAGGTALNGGILSISADGATTGAPGSLGEVPALAAPNNLIFNGGDLLATTTLTLQTNRTIGIGSTVSLNTNTTTALIDAAAGQILTIDGVIASAGNAGRNNLTVNSQAGDTGTVVLAGADTFNGTNVIVAGEEQLGNPLALQNSTLFYNQQGGVLDFGTQTAATLSGLLGAQNLTLENDSSAAVALTLSSVNSAVTVYTGILGDNSSGGSLTISGGGAAQQIGSGTSGGATYTGATTLEQGSLILGGNTALTGALNFPALNGACNLTVQDQATITAGSEIYLASAGGTAYPGACTMTLLGNANVSAPAFSFGEGTRIPAGSYVTISGNATLNIAGDFELEDAEGSTAQNNTVNLNGGTLAVGNFTLTYATAGTHQATINFNGGVLQANAADNGGTLFLPALTALTVNVLTNGALINPNNDAITIAAVLAGAGGLTNLGPGTLNLSGANTYAGATTIDSGATLSVINTTGSATGTNIVTVLGGGTLEGTGTVAGNVTVNSGGTLAGTETISGTLTMLTGALATFNAGPTPTPLAAGVVALNNNVVTVNVLGSALSVGSYTLMSYTVAGSTGAFSPTPNFTGAGLANGLLAVITTSGGSVTLSVAPNVTYDVWDVDANGTWTTATDWSSNPTVPGNPGDAALLGIGSALRTVTLNHNESLGYLTMTNAHSFVVAGSDPLTLDNSGNGAYLTVNGGATNQIQTPVSLNDNASITVGSGDLLAITGVVANSPSATPTLTIGGQGELILAGANTYGPPQGSGGTTLQGGTLQVNNNHSLSMGDVNVAGTSTLQSGAANLVVTNNFNLNAGVMTVNDNGNVFTLGGTFQSGGGLLKTGAGTLFLTNNNSFSGGLTIHSGTVVLNGYSSGGDGGVTNGAVLQLANPSAVGGGSLTLNSGSTLQLRSDTTATFSPNGLVPQNAQDTLNFDVGPVTPGVAGQILTLSGNLAFADSQVNQIINVTGTNGYTLVLGDLSATSATTHNPYQMVDINVIPGITAQLGSFTTGNWGDFLNFSGGGNDIFSGTFGNTSNGSGILTVNDGSLVTFTGSTVKSATGDSYSYLVQNGTLVVDSSTALINNTDGTTDNNISFFILGPATNVVTAGTDSLPTGFETVNTNNNVNCAFYLGDANNYYGGLSVTATVTNNVSDGDVGFTNNGVMTIGGQNTTGINTFNNPIILGWTTNRGKSVTLVAAPGGEVDFAGPILANGTDQSAGITVGTPAFTGLVKLYATTNTYRGPTIINYGTLALADNGNDAYIASSASIVINAGAVLDVSLQSAENYTFPLGTGAVAQTLSGSGGLNGSLTVGALGTVAPGTPTTLGTLTVSNNVTLGGNLVLKLSNVGGPKSDHLVVVPFNGNGGTLTYGGTLTVTNIGPALVPGSTFQLFPGAVTSFSNIILPVSDNNYRYVWNNQVTTLGSITLQSATMLVNTNPLTAYFKGVPVPNNKLNFTWAADHQGWQLYTNIVGLTSANSWFPLAGSANGTNTTITINPAQPQVFFQLRYP